MPDEQPSWRRAVTRVAALPALFLAACGADAIVPSPPPVHLTFVMSPGYEVICVETLTRILIPGVAPVIGWAKRTFNCEVVQRTPIVITKVRKET